MLKELLQKIVETDDMDARMDLAEQFTGELDKLSESGNSSELQAEIDRLSAELETANKGLADSKQKYRDRFFKGSDDSDSMDSQKENKEEEKEKRMSIEEVVDNVK